MREIKRMRNRALQSRRAERIKESLLMRERS